MNPCYQSYLVFMLQELQESCLADGLTALLLTHHKGDHPLLPDDPMRLSVHHSNTKKLQASCSQLHMLTSVALLAAEAAFLCC
jgi:hypothetical protein